MPRSVGRSQQTRRLPATRTFTNGALQSYALGALNSEAQTTVNLFIHGSSGTPGGAVEFRTSIREQATTRLLAPASPWGWFIQKREMPGLKVTARRNKQ